MPPRRGGRGRGGGRPRPPQAIRNTMSEIGRGSIANFELMVQATAHANADAARAYFPVLGPERKAQAVQLHESERKLVELGQQVQAAMLRSPHAIRAERPRADFVGGLAVGAESGKEKETGQKAGSGVGTADEGKKSEDGTTVGNGAAKRTDKAGDVADGSGWKARTERLASFFASGTQQAGANGNGVAGGNAGVSAGETSDAAQARRTASSIWEMDKHWVISELLPRELLPRELRKTTVERGRANRKRARRAAGDAALVGDGGGAQEAAAAGDEGDASGGDEDEAGDGAAAGAGEADADSDLELDADYQTGHHFDDDEGYEDADSGAEEATF